MEPAWVQSGYLIFAFVTFVGLMILIDQWWGGWYQPGALRRLACIVLGVLWPLVALILAASAVQRLRGRRPTYFATLLRELKAPY